MYVDSNLEFQFFFISFIHRNIYKYIYINIEFIGIITWVRGWDMDSLKEMVEKEYPGISFQ